MKSINRKDLHIEDIRTEEYWNRLRIYSLSSKDISKSRYIVNKSLNSKNKVLNIIKSNDINKDIDISDMYGLNSNTFIIDNLPIYTYLKISNIFNKGFNRIRKYKYIDRDTTYFVRIPKEVCPNIDVRKEYENIQLKAIKNFRDIYKQKGRYPKEISKYILPLGVQNRAVFSMTLDNSILLTNELLCSDMVLDNQLGDMLEKLLEKDVPINTECSRRTVIKNVLTYLGDILSDSQEFKFSISEMSESFRFSYITDIVEDLISNFELLINPLGSKEELEFDYDDQINIGKIIKGVNLGNISKSKGSSIKGYLPLSSILDLQEMGMDIFVPFLSDFVNIDNELSRKSSESFYIPSLLEEYQEINKDVEKKISEIYLDIKRWREKSLQYMSNEMSKEFTKYLLPISHLTSFNMYLDINDISILRRNKFEYIEYWNKLFFRKDPLFKK